MKPKTIVTIALVIFLCAAAAYLVLDEVRAKSAARLAGKEQLQQGEVDASSSERHGSTPTIPQESTDLAEGTTTISDKVEPSNPEKTASIVPAETRPATMPSQLLKKESVNTAVNPSGPKKEQTIASRQIASEQHKQVSAQSKQTGVAPSSQPPGSQVTGSQSVSSRSIGSPSGDSKSSPPKPADSQNPQVTSAQKILAYYFHGTQRCPTCRKLEAYSAEAIEKGFGEALKRGNLEWRVVNVDEPLNKHFVKDYQLYTKSLVIVKMQGGKQVEWKNLEKIWELVGEKDDFVRYVQDEVSAYLGERK